MILLSDTFSQFATPLMAQLGWPTILCHDLEVVDDRIVGYRLRMADQKRHAVLAFQSLGYRVLAGGDSYNDVSMLLAADVGFLFRAPERVRAEFPQLRGARCLRRARRGTGDRLTDPARPPDGAGIRPAAPHGGGS